MSTPRRIPHEMILASAGTGKTYQLTHRYIRLLATHRAPERILALTFTRKAAGEFFEKIFQKLADAASSEAAADRLSQDLDLDAVSADFRALLRLLIDRLHRLSLSTFDSFFVRIVQAFPLELGLAGPPNILDTAAQDEALRLVERRVFRRGRLPEAVRQEFWHAFKLATFGLEEKRLAELLTEFVARHHDLVVDTADPAAWGGEERIWPAGNPWRTPAPLDVAATVRTLREELAAQTLTPQQCQDWETFCQEIAAWVPHTEVPPAMKKFLGKFTEAWPALAKGYAEIVVRKKQVLTPGLCAAVQALTRHVVGSELELRRQRTRGIREVVTLFERVYAEEVRRLGRLTFADITRLLATPDAETGASSPTHADADTRLLLDFRLDGTYDHWLFDEFQDTSLAQWRVVENLIDEVMQDAEEVKTLFCVGDLKQAIYLWRQSDDRLFHHLLARYPGQIAVRSLDVSQRSSEPVLALVNAVFDANTVIGDLFGKGVAARWERGWVRHRSAVRIAALPAYAAWVDAGTEDSGRHEAVRRLLAEIRPLERGWSAAILVRTNDEALALAEYLRAHGGPPVITASDVYPCQDNALAAALVSLLQSAAHPADTLAGRHSELIPASAWTAGQETWGERQASELLRRVAAEGFEAACRYLLGWLRPAVEADDFSRLRAEQFLEAARRFDLGGSRDIDAFLRFAATYSLRDERAPAAVNILTIHKSKGLDFDLVLVPALEGNTLRERRDGFAVQRDDAGRVEWILDLPPKYLTLADPALERHRTCAEDDGCYENLCLLYVALTRARRGLYVITSTPKPKSSSTNYVKLLAETLGEEQAGELALADGPLPVRWQTGEPRWYEATKGVSAQPTPPEVTAVFRLATELSATPARRLTPVTPSAGEERLVPGAALFHPEAFAAAEFGERVHAGLARVGWLAEGEWPDGSGEGDAQVAAEIRACLAAPEIRALFTAPDGPGELWRERAFEVTAGNRLIGGRFDRVILRRNAAGQAIAATLVDFKTDRLAPDASLTAAAGRHRAQMDAYTAALAQLAGLPEEKIERVLVFTRRRRAVREEK